MVLDGLLDACSLGFNDKVKSAAQRRKTFGTLSNGSQRHKRILEREKIQYFLSLESALLVLK